VVREGPEPVRNSADKNGGDGIAGQVRGRVVPLRSDAGLAAVAATRALDAIGVYLDRCNLAANTVKAYRTLQRKQPTG
jgi:hypothetical protein